MTASSLGSLLVLAALGLGLVAGMRWHAAAPVVTAAVSAIPPLRSAPIRVTDDSIVDAESLIVDNDPFRISNVPPTARFIVAAEGAAGATVSASPVPRPSLALKAIVGGPPWRAIIDGIPGQPAGTMAEPGSKFDRLVVRSVTRDSVIVQWTDTSWVLTFARRS